ncbi:bifunctional DNA-formamidopyrimidine glycosylase/DNA-(apurinic or apyrimidinic site) lyase [Solimicrobium silvestre]|uniref:Formamidopyrimidine-DNA glycosylase n=1 Tax=Solimicrobium silvestre TaxID=2099400 RepID=A0A2S9H1E5_9BURK|nr:bifunctional DNA-formamidopyrimidine glycosylase/DNA-(apurinic or apyrimidinic site) lyase [Solimicrobium silvestre]PRC93770.1 fpg: formamidopyrimidine-DNA glycosylase [Solimicrobium silvestre]
MPELPEVEVTRLGVSPYLVEQRVTGLVLRRAGLRWPFPADLAQKVVGQTVQSTGRRGKYLLIVFKKGTLIIHLGMSGHIRILPIHTPAQLHDHMDIVLGEQLLRLTDPRRFGAVLWHDAADGAIEQYPLLQRLGMEPLTEQFNGAVLYTATRHRKIAVKQMLLAGDVVVGVGNIYASESLFISGINPYTPSSELTLARYKKLALAIQKILADAITKGGSSLRDFVGVDGQSGYFQQNYYVYDRTGLPCRKCNTLIQQVKQGQRSTFYCVKCQK